MNQLMMANGITFVRLGETVMAHGSSTCDGVLRRQGTGLKTGYTITGGGSLVLGQEQDSVGGGFDANQSFQGSLTNVNVWSSVLTASAIKSLSDSCLSTLEGDVYEWSDFRDGVKGGAAIVIPSPCVP